MKRIEWQYHIAAFGAECLKPQLAGVDLDDPFYDEIFDKFCPLAYLSELTGTALLACFKSGKVETINGETATPMGNGRYLVEYEVEENEDNHLHKQDRV